MKPAEFTYHRPGTLDEALELCAESRDGKILAGGQSLIPLLSMRLARISELIDINGIGELSHITVDPTGVRFGAGVRHSELLDHAEVARVQPLIPAVLRHVAHPTIRNRGTTVGSIVHADASGEMPAVFALLGGTLTAHSVRGAREISAPDLFLGALETSLAPDEIATEVFLPALASSHSSGDGVAFEEVARRHGDYALCGVAAVVRVTDDGRIASVRAGYVSVSDTPVVVDLTEAFGGDGSSAESPAAINLTAENLAAAGELALAHLEPESDVHATARYRAQLVRVLTERVVRAACDDAVTRTKRLNLKG